MTGGDLECILNQRLKGGAVFLIMNNYVFALATGQHTVAILLTWVPSLIKGISYRPTRYIGMSIKARPE
jgi:hypothetical protein